MGSRPLEGNDSDFRVFNVNQQPIGIDVTFPKAFVLAMKLVVAVFFRDWLAFFQQIGDGKKVI